MALTKRQKNLIEFMLAHPEMPETVCARECEVPNSTYFDWKKKEEFTEELDRRLKEQWKDAERLAVDKMIGMANEGCFQATKYILDNLGYAPTQKIKADISTDINITIGE